MRTINYYEEQPKEYEIIPVGKTRAWVYVRSDITECKEADEEGKERIVWSATEYSTQVNALKFEITDAFAARLIESETKKAAKAVRERRNRLLEQTDNKMLPDRLDPALAGYKALAAYRQALRDIPEQEGFPFDIIWPEAVEE